VTLVLGPHFPDGLIRREKAAPEIHPAVELVKPARREGESNRVWARAFRDTFPRFAEFCVDAEDARRAFAEDMRDRATRRLWNFGVADARRFFLAGGGSAGDFAVHFARALTSREKIIRGLDDATYHGVDGGAFYLVAGRKGRSS